LHTRTSRICLKPASRRELHRQGVTGVQYEFAAGVGNSTVDFQLPTEPLYLVEVVSIGRSDAKGREGKGREGKGREGKGNVR
jgi:hypothetical protein